MNKRQCSKLRSIVKKAKKLIDLDNALDFYNALSRALLEYIANKTNVSAEGLTSNIISDLLSKKEVPAADITEVNKILEECDMVRFAPSQVTEVMKHNIFRQTSDIINMLEKEL